MGVVKSFKRISVPATPVTPDPAPAAAVAPAAGASAPQSGKLPSLTKEFVFAGRAAFSVSNPKGEHYTFKVRGKDSVWQGRKQRSYFLSVKASGGRFPYRYIGIVNADGSIKTTGKSDFLPETKEYKVAAWALQRVIRGGVIPDGYEIRHVGKCGRCGRTLTDPTSIDRGIGPECWSIMGH